MTGDTTFQSTHHEEYSSSGFEDVFANGYTPPLQKFSRFCCNGAVGVTGALKESLQEWLQCVRSRPPSPHRLLANSLGRVFVFICFSAPFTFSGGPNCFNIIYLKGAHNSSAPFLMEDKLLRARLGGKYSSISSALFL